MMCSVAVLVVLVGWGLATGGHVWVGVCSVVTRCRPVVACWELFAELLESPCCGSPADVGEVL
ncbi:hypothetical protein HBB16_04980 [Pseudonocardia sp. MCCB 268]|nr:hypothetical protein [Pseudonocardia cytotoxica]